MTDLAANRETRHRHSNSDGSGGRTLGRWAAFEVAVAALAVVLDVFVPTIIILALLTVSLLARREGLHTLGFAKPDAPGRMAWQIPTLVVVWTFLHLAIFMPLMERLIGETRDLSGFQQVEGDLGALMVFLLLTWTLAAFGEETVYRGFIHTRTAEAVARGRLGVVAGVLVSAALFGLAHTEQGAVGVGLTFLDAMFFSGLLLHYKTVWAPVLAHGLINTIGLVAFYFTGPVYGLW